MLMHTQLQRFNASANFPIAYSYDTSNSQYTSGAKSHLVLEMRAL